jgi:PAS domain S-box-containing protein
VSLIELLGTGPGSSVYHLLTVPVLGMMALIALIQWRHTRNPDYRRIVWAFAGVLVLRLPLPLGELGTVSKFVAVIAPFLRGMEAASLTLLGWAFLAPLLSHRTVRLYLPCGIGVTLLCAVAFLPAWYTALGRFSYSLLNATFWQQSIWHALSLLMASIPSVILLLRRQREEHWMAVAGFAVLALGSAILLVGSLLLVADLLKEPAHNTWIGTGRLINLLGYSLFAVAVYRIAMQDMWAYRQELQTMSEEALRQAKELFFLVEASRTIGESLNLDAILLRVVESTTMALDADRAAIFLINLEEPDRASLAAQYTHLQRAERPGTHATFPLAEQPTLEYALQRRKQLIINVETDNPRLQALYGLLGSQRAGPTIVQPFLRQDRVLGALVVGNDHSQCAFEPNKGRLCQSIAVQVAAAIENARLYRDLQAQAGQLAELLQAQEEDVRRTTAILESVTEGVIVSDGEGHITIVNAAAERILGAPRQRIQGRLLKRLAGHTALDPGTDWEVIAQADSPLQTVFELEGKVVYISAAPVLTPAGDHLGIVAVLRDITRETEAERAKSEFITVISHELRTPLTAIQGYAEALTSGMVGTVSESQARFLNIIHDNALRMGNLAENLIAVSEVEGGGLKLEYVEMDLHLVVGEVVRAFRSELEARQLELSLELDDGLPLIEADPARVRQILDNLVSNAVKFTYPGGCVTIGAKLLRDDEGRSPTHCALWVADTGIGISSEEQAHIWERFYRPTNPLAAEAGGLGVGLSIVKSLVEAHAGRVWLESTPGVGSTFTAVLPIKRAQPVGDQQSRAVVAD